MKKAFGVMLIAAFLMAVLCSCAVPAISASPIQTVDERVLSDARVQYHDASLIVRGSCMQTHTNATGHACSDLLINDVLAGKADVGGIIHCTQGTMEKGKEYLLYLDENKADVNHAEDTAGYRLSADAPMEIVDSDVFWNGTRVPLSVLLDDMQQLSSVLSVPAPLYYYDDLKQLVDASSEIFIGRVISLPQMEEYTFSIRSGGTGEKAQSPASIAKVEAYGAIKGVLRYGQNIDLVHCPARIGELVDASTLKPLEYDSTQAAQLQEGEYYLFFLNPGVDSKQPYYFPVNPVQGYAEVNGEALSVSPANDPLGSYVQLTPLIQAIQNAMNTTAADATAPLIVDNSK